MRIAVLDDYQNVALSLADWSPVTAKADVTVFNDHLTGLDDVAARLEPFEAVAIMRERTPFPKALFERLPNLKLLITTGMRNWGIDMEAAAERGVTVCGAESVGASTAELTWGLIHSLARKIPAEDRATREGRWQLAVGTALNGRTLGVLGLGKLGGKVAQVGLAFNMNVIAWSQNLTEARCAEIGAKLVDKETLFRESDFLSLHVVLGDRTRGIVGKADLALMKPTAYLINTARGPLVDRDALLETLTEGRIAGAGLDVFDTEPLPPDDPFRNLPNTVITPHLGYVADQSYDLWYRQIVECLTAWVDGKELPRVLKT